MLISSRANARIKHLRRLRTRRGREESDLFLAEGLRLARDAVECGAEIVSLVIAPALLDEEAAQEVASLRQSADAEVLEVTPEVLETLTPQGVGEGVVLAARRRWRRLEEVAPSDRSLWVAAHRVEHPGTLGTILRTLDAVGGEGLIVLDDSADPHDPVAVRASLGAVFTRQLVRARWPEFAEWKRRTGCHLVGAAPSAGADYRQAAYPRPLVILLGSERGGLSEEQTALCDQVVAIPMRGRVDSLHLSVAAGLLLYQAAG